MVREKSEAVTGTSDHWFRRRTKRLFIGNGGDVVGYLVGDGYPRTFPALASGSEFNGAFAAILKEGTTASGILGIQDPSAEAVERLEDDMGCCYNILEETDARGDGATNDTAAFLEAKNATNNGDSIYLPNTGNSYLIDADAVDFSNRRWYGSQGSGSAGTTLKAATAGTTLVLANGRVGLQSINLDANNLTTHCLQMPGASHDSLLRELRMEHALGAGWYAKDSTLRGEWVLIENCDKGADLVGLNGSMLVGLMLANNTDEGLIISGSNSGRTSQAGSLTIFGLQLEVNNAAAATYQCIIDGAVGVKIYGDYCEGRQLFELKNKTNGCLLSGLRVITALSDYAAVLTEAWGNRFEGWLSAGGGSSERFYVSSLSHENSFAGCHRESFLVAEPMQVVLQNGTYDTGSGTQQPLVLDIGRDGRLLYANPGTAPYGNGLTTTRRYIRGAVLWARDVASGQVYGVVNVASTGPTPEWKAIGTVA